MAEESIEDRITGIEKVEAFKGSHEALEAGKVPVDLTLTFENRGISEDEVRTIVNTSVRSILMGYRVAEHYAQPNQPLNFDIEIIDRKVTAIIHTWGISRHPAQLYESGTSLILFFILLGLWINYKEKTPDGLYLGIFLIWIFGLRWLHETFKENQVAFEDDLTYNMGQLLSIPMVLLGVFILTRVYVKYTKTTKF